MSRAVGVKKSTFGRLLVLLRKSRGLRQKDLLDMMGKNGHPISQSKLSKHETDELPDAEFVYHIGRTLFLNDEEIYELLQACIFDFTEILLNEYKEHEEMHKKKESE